MKRNQTKPLDGPPTNTHTSIINVPTELFGPSPAVWSERNMHIETLGDLESDSDTDGQWVTSTFDLAFR